MEQFNSYIKRTLIAIGFYVIIGLVITIIVGLQKELDPIAYFFLPACLGSLGIFFNGYAYEDTYQTQKKTITNSITEPNKKKLQEQENQPEDKHIMNETKKRKMTITIEYNGDGEKQNGTFECINKH